MQSARRPRKGQFELSMTVIEVVIIVVGLFVLLSILRMWWQPYRQAAFANAELLRLTIDDVCAGGVGTTKTIDFNFPQPEPFTALGAPKLRQIVPGIMIKTNGDPHFVIYYQSFPPGEGILWEMNLDLPPRLFVPLPALSTEERTAAKQYIETILARIRGRPEYANASVIFTNIILGESGLLGDIGNWTDGVYKFRSLLNASQLDKSSVKYRACSDKPALCLKTRDGVYVLPLPSCKGIETILLTFDIHTLFSARPGAYLEVPGATDNSVDLNIASPCSTRLEITKTQCTCDDVTTFVKAGMGYPLYTYDGEQLKPVGSRMSCLHRIGDVPDKGNVPYSRYTDIPCISIKMKKPDPKHLCVTPNNLRPPTVLRRPVTSSTKFVTLPPEVSGVWVQATAQTSDDLTGITGVTTWAWP